MPSPGSHLGQVELNPSPGQAGLRPTLGTAPWHSDVACLQTKGLHLTHFVLLIIFGFNSRISLV